jgi:hypothetical protein
VARGAAVSQLGVPQVEAFPAFEKALLEFLR